MRGKIKWYDATKGYGFILTEDNSELFMHRSGIKNPAANLDNDQPVEFEIAEGKKGPIAVDVIAVD